MEKIREVLNIPNVSVIVPCYNAEDYIEKCIQSIIAQSLRDIEIIAVNDGSTDTTSSILHSFAERDNRVTVIDLKNGGYGRAVNTGMSVAQGVYIGIVESDDFIDKKMYKTLYNLSYDGTVDVVKGNFSDYYERENEMPQTIVNNERAKVLDLGEPFAVRKNPEILWGHPSVWSAIYRRKFLIENDIKFMEVKGGGWVDNPFFFETLCNAKSIMWTKEPLYFYRKTNPNSSSQRIENPILPFERMSDNLDVLERSGYMDDESAKMAAARTLMYLRGALVECDYQNNYDTINQHAKALMQRLDSDVLFSQFNLQDQVTFLDFASPIKTLQAKQPKILLYNWLPFDNQWGWGGGVTLYCNNVINTMLKRYPNAQIYFLSSGFAYMATTTNISYRKIPNVFGNRVQQFEIVNSPVPADQRNIYSNPLVAIESQDLKDIFNKFIDTFGVFTAIHFNNIEGLSLDVFDLKNDYPDTKFIFSIHNYIPMCITGFYYMRHKHCNCSPKHTGEDCFDCVHCDIDNEFAKKTYERGLFGQDLDKCIPQKQWIKTLGFDRLDQMCNVDNILKFAQTATNKINENCDSILAVSKRVYDIAAGEGFDENKMFISYIGTKVAKRQVKKSLAEVENGLKIVFLGSDLHYEEKGYPWLLNTLENLETKYASQIDLLFTTRNAEHREIFTKCKNFRSVKVKVGYKHSDLEWLLDGCHLGIVPVLWEDNLPQITIEMVAYGVPVLASSVGGASELCDCDLFRFKCGDSDDFLAKLVHLLENPEDLQEYWNNHHGLVTMEDHISELLQYYGLSKEPLPIEIGQQDYAYLLMEHEFLKKHLSLYNVTPQVHEESNKQAEMRRNLSKSKTSFNGRIVFSVPCDKTQDVVGANLFKIILEKFDYSDFYIEIKFIKLMNIRQSYSDILRISGTWHNESGEYKLHIHNSEFEKMNIEIADWIYMYIRENELHFWGRFPGLWCGFAWEIITSSTRADHDIVTFDNSHKLINIAYNEIVPDDAFKAKIVSSSKKKWGDLLKNSLRNN